MATDGRIEMLADVINKMRPVVDRHVEAGFTREEAFKLLLYFELPILWALSAEEPMTRTEPEPADAE